MKDEEALAMALGVNLLAAAGALTAAIHDGVLARGFDDLRPAHGFAFARMAAGGATVTELAAHLGVTRQAAGQLVDELEAKGYAEVTGLTKGEDGIWSASATKDGKPTTVKLDFQGNITDAPK